MGRSLGGKKSCVTAEDRYEMTHELHEHNFSHLSSLSSPIYEHACARTQSQEFTAACGEMQMTGSVASAFALSS